MTSSRRQFLRYSAVGVALGLAGCSSDEAPVADTTPQSDPTTDGAPATETTEATPRQTTTDQSGTPSPSMPETITARRVASGFTAPVGFESVPGRDGSWVVVDQDGRVWLYDGTEILADPMLDVREQMVDINSGYDERGLLGLAFHPAFTDNGKLYARYSAPSRAGTPDDYSHTFVLSEFTVADSGRTVPLDSERTVMQIPQPQGNHNAGAIAFGPDGLLYVGVGDGGGANDEGTGHVTDWYDANAGGNGQDITENLLGSILRIDVDRREDSLGYAVPDSNPLVGADGLDEHFAWGLRNPWRMSFSDGDLYVADVGQNEYEEVNIVEAGGNYGWNVREASHCFGAASCPSESPRGRALQDPIIEYDHGGDPPNGIAVIGGYRYRGDALSDLEGTYVFSDWRADGTLLAATPSESGLWPVSTLDVTAQNRDGIGSMVLAFGRDHDDELYVCTTENGGPRGDTGEVYKLVATA